MDPRFPARSHQTIVWLTAQKASWRPCPTEADSWSICKCDDSGTTMLSSTDVPYRTSFFGRPMPHDAICSNCLITRLVKLSILLLLHCSGFLRTNIWFWLFACVRSANDGQLHHLSQWHPISNTLSGMSHSNLLPLSPLSPNSIPMTIPFNSARDVVLLISFYLCFNTSNWKSGLFRLRTHKFRGLES